MSQSSSLPHAASATPAPGIQTRRGAVAQRLCERLLALLAMTAAGASHAEVHCVDAEASGDDLTCRLVGSTTVCGLRRAFEDVREAPAETRHEIRIPVGTYHFTGISGLGVVPNADRDGKSLIVSGGWNATCTSRASDPSDTVLDGSADIANADVFFRGRFRELVVENLSLNNFRDFGALVTLCTDIECHDTRLLRVRGVRFTQGRMVGAGGYDISRMSFSNNVVARLSGTTPMVFLYHYNPYTAPDISHNTFADLDCGGSTSNGAVGIASRFPETRIHHNIVQSRHCASDFALLDSQPVFLDHNLYTTTTGTAPIDGGGNVLSADPGFVDAANLNYRLADDSAAINAGMTVDEATHQRIAFPAVDFVGAPRVVGTRINIGAYEAGLDNDNGKIVVSNNNDSGTGSLRSAMTAANVFPGRQRIVFDLPGNCPQLIHLQTPLPNVIGDLEIDGYTQPGARANTRQTGSDAKLCIGLVAGGEISHFLLVPQTAAPDVGLTVKGIAFIGTSDTGHSDVHLGLLGGSDHLIAGNAFDGEGSGQLGGLGSSYLGITLQGAAQHAWIGGPLPEHRNSFGNMQMSAIRLLGADSGNIDAHVVQNNYMGLSMDGEEFRPIALNAIAATDTPGVSILDNVIGATPDSSAIVVSGATAAEYRIAGNTIGTRASGPQFDGSHVHTGIRILGGAGAHLIGDEHGDGFANFIVEPKKAGVWLEDTAGNGNRVRANLIWGPGADGSGALAVDLGALGALPNDANDADAGPNNGQNAPVLVSSTSGLPGIQDVLLTLDSTPNSDFSIDFYRTYYANCRENSDAGPSLRAWLGQLDLHTDAAGHAEAIAMLKKDAGGDNSLVAIATNSNTGDSSESSACLMDVPDLIFGNGLE